MKTTIEERWGTHPNDVKHYDTAQLRKEFLVENLFAADEVLLTYTHNDRLIIGGIFPVNETLKLETVDLIRSEYFCERREAGIICIENSGVITVDGKDFPMTFKDTLYIELHAVLFHYFLFVVPQQFHNRRPNSPQTRQSDVYLPHRLET